MEGDDGIAIGGTKEQPLRSVIAVLEASGTSYAVIGGVAVQLYSREPRTTLDIDLAVARHDDIPRAALMKAGFVHEERHLPPSGGLGHTRMAHLDG